MERRKFLKTGAGVAGFGLMAGCIGGGGDGGGDGGSDGGGDGGSDGGGDGGSDGGGDGGSDGGDGGDGGGSTDTPSGPIRIGGIEPLSGPFSPWGKAHLPGLEFAVEQINADGGVMGRDLELVAEDTESNSSTAANIIQRFVEQEDVVAVTGPVSSDVGIRASRAAEEIGVPMYSHMAGTPAYTKCDNRYTFRVGEPPAPKFVAPQEDLIKDRGYTKVGAIIADYAWGQAVRNALEGFDADIQFQVLPVGASDFSSALRQFPQDLEMLIATGHPPGTITIFSQMLELGLEPEIYTDPGFPPSLIWNALGESATQGFTHSHLTDVYADDYPELAKKFTEAKGQRMGTHVGYGYVTGQLIAAAMEETGSVGRDAVAEGTRNVSLDTIYINPLEYTEWGEPKNMRYMLSGFEPGAPDYYPDGKFKLVEQIRAGALSAYDPGC